MAIEGVTIAFTSAMLEPDPLWTRIDQTVRIARWETTTGRQDEFDRTGTGTATIRVNDVDGAFDPSNASSAYYGMLDGKQAALALKNPLTSVWHTRFRGHIDDYSQTVDASQEVTWIDIPLVDTFDFLESVELTPGLAGFTPPAGVEGNIFYEDAGVRPRMWSALGDAAYPLTLTNLFSGNVTVQETIYQPGVSVLTVLRDAADSEFPGVANLFVNCDGILTFHGRLARFYPDTYGIPTWYLGDGVQALADPNYAQIRGLTFSRPRRRIINAALASPQGIAVADIAGQVVSDTTSITNYGLRPWSAENLLTLHDNLMNLDANPATKLFATYYVQNFKAPRTTVDRIVVKSIKPEDPRGPATWAFLCGVQISDIVHLKATNPGGGGFDEDFYVEGLNYECEPLNADYPLVTLTLNVSPKAHWDTNPFL